MHTNTEIPSLDSLEYIPYLDDQGQIAPEVENKIGVYGIFDRAQVLQFVGYSRNIYLSLKQHLVRQPDNCYWLKFQTISRPSRQILEDIAQAWIESNGTVPPGNQEQVKIWTEPIDTQGAMTDSEKSQYSQNDELGQIKIRKQVARRVEASIKQTLSERGVNMDIRFNPKLKERGLLDLK